jgi:hypothetical protein
MRSRSEGVSAAGGSNETANRTADSFLGYEVLYPRFYIPYGLPFGQGSVFIVAVARVFLLASDGAMQDETPGR